MVKLKSKHYHHYKGKVYDLSVKENCSYNVNGLAVHNSGAGSLVCYAIGITQVDPIRHGLLFERFLSKKKAGLPDIDCLLSTTLVQTVNGYKPISNIKVGDEVVGNDGKVEKVLAVQNRSSTCEDTLLELFIQIDNTIGCIVATSKHRLFTQDNREVFVGDLKVGDTIKSICGKAFVLEKREITEPIEVTDITTTGSKSFNIVPFDVIRDEEKLISVHTYNPTGYHSCLLKNLTIVSHNSDCADRETAIKILIEHFGEECVLPVSNYNQLQLKSLIKDLARLYQIPFDVINPLTQQIEKETLDADKQQEGFDRGVWFLSFESAEKNSPTFRQLLVDFPQLESSLKVLFKQIKSCFSEDTLLLTNKGWKRYRDIDENVHKIGFVNTVGEVEFNGDYFKIDNGEKEIYKIALENGKELELTGDHLVQTQSGWKPVSDLTVEDSLIGWM
jgi:hypothetical protein